MWKWVLGPAAGGHELELTAASQRQVTFRLAGSHEASCSLDGRHEQASSVRELASDLHVLRDGQILYRGRVGAPSDTVSMTSHRVVVPSVDYREVLRRRLLYADSTLVFGSTDQSVIAWTLVDETQNRTGGDLGISRGAGQVTERLRDRTYEPGQSVGELIDDLSQVIDGFDWDVEPTSASGLACNVYYPSRGASRGVVLDHGGSVVSGQRTVDPRSYANATRTSGAEGTVAQTREVPDLASRPEGRWDGQFGYPSISVQSTVDERADADLQAASDLVPSWTVRLRPGWWQGPGQLWLGDTVRLVVMSGRLATDTLVRVYEIDVSVGLSGEEDVSVTLGAPRPDFARRQRVQTRKLRDLERR